MDIVVDRVLELGVGLIMRGDRAASVALEQPDRAAGEDTAIALEIMAPGLVIDFIAEDF